MSSMVSTLSKLRSLKRRIAAGFAASSAASTSLRSPQIARKGAGDAAISFDSDFGWRPMTGGRFNVSYTGSNIDWAKEVGPLWQNPAIAICIGFLWEKVIEAVPEVVSGKNDDDGQRKPVPDAALLSLLETPNPEYGWEPLLQATAFSLKLDGNGYWVKVRGDVAGIRSVGEVKEVWYVPHWQMEPVAPEDGGPTQVYKRAVGNKVTFYAKDDIIHFRSGMDPENPRKGWSRFKALLREVLTDNEIALFNASVMRNLGVIGSLISPGKDGDEFDPDDADELKTRIKNASTGDVRGDVVVSSIPLAVHRVSYSPQELAVGEMGKRPEARICAGFGFNPMAVGLPSDNMKYANLKEARAGCWEDSIIPCLTLIAQRISHDLLPEMGGKRGQLFRFNYSAVRDLMPDQVAEQKRARDNWEKGGWTLDEFRKATGQKADPKFGGKYFWQVQTAKKPDPNTDPNDPTDPETGDEEKP